MSYRSLQPGSGLLERVRSAALRGRQLRRLVIFQRHAMRRLVLADLKGAASNLHLGRGATSGDKTGAGARRSGSAPALRPHWLHAVRPVRIPSTTEGVAGLVEAFGVFGPRTP